MVRRRALAIALLAWLAGGAVARADREVLLGGPVDAGAAPSMAAILDEVFGPGARAGGTDGGAAAARLRGLTQLIDFMNDRGPEVMEGIAARMERGAPALDLALALHHEERGRLVAAAAAYRRYLAARPAPPDAPRVAAHLARIEADLRRARAEPVVCPDDRPALYAVEDPDGGTHLDRPAILLVHGYTGAPVDLDDVAARFRGAGAQLYVVCYESRRRRLRESGAHVAEVIRSLAARSPGARASITIVAHSLGGLVTRLALNQLALAPRHPLAQCRRIDVYAIDSPWHGYVGPPDDGPMGALYRLAAPLIPAGIREMRAPSYLFVGDPSARDPVERAGLYGVELPPAVHLHLVFAASSDGIFHHGQDFLAALPAVLARHFGADEPVRGEARLVNYWRALLSSDEYPAFAEEMRALADRGALDPAAVAAALDRHYPVFPGNHTSVMREQPAGVRSLLDHLWSRVSATASLAATPPGAPVPVEVAAPPAGRVDGGAAR